MVKRIAWQHHCAECLDRGASDMQPGSNWAASRSFRRARKKMVWAVACLATAGLVACSGGTTSTLPSSEGASGPSSSSGIVAASEPRTSGPQVCHRLAGSAPIRQLPDAVELQSDAGLGRQARAAITDAVSQLVQIADTTANPLSLDLDRAAAALKLLENPKIPNAAEDAVVTKALTTLGKQAQRECDFSVG